MHDHRKAHTPVPQLPRRASLERAKFELTAEYVLPLLSFSSTLLLTLLSGFVVGLDREGTFLVFATGTSVTLALTLIEKRLATMQREITSELTLEMNKRLDLWRVLDGIDDKDLADEVYSLARVLGSGQVPPHIAAIRIPLLYERAQNHVYASNVSLTTDQLCRWEENPRFRSIVAASARRSREGVTFSRTFVLRRSAALSDGTLEPRSLRVLMAQMDAGIAIRVIWLEDLEDDIVRPSRRVQCNFTIFDDMEAVDTTDVQVIYRAPSERLQEFIALRKEQLKYAVDLDRYLPGNATGRNT